MSGNHPRTPEVDARDAEVIRRRLAGESPREIAAAMSVPRPIVSNTIAQARRRGVQFPDVPVGRPVSDLRERDAPILAMYAAGKTTYAIAVESKLPRGTIATIIHRNAKAGVITLRSRE